MSDIQSNNTADPRHKQQRGLGLNTGMSQQERDLRKSVTFMGFEIKRKSKDQGDGMSFVPPVEENEGAYLTSAGGGFFGTQLDVRGDSYQNDKELIHKYRNAALQPECDAAIEDIVSEAIVSNSRDLPIKLNMPYAILWTAYKYQEWG